MLAALLALLAPLALLHGSRLKHIRLNQLRSSSAMLLMLRRRHRDDEPARCEEEQ